MSMLINPYRFGLSGGIGPGPSGDEVSARAWRIYGLKGQGNNPQYNQIQLRHTIGGTDQSGLGTAIGTRFNASYDPVYAFDNNAATQWAALGHERQWVGMDFGIGNSMVLREMVLEQSTPYPHERWRSVLVQYSQDMTTWHDYCLSVDALPTLTPTMAITGNQTFTVAPRRFLPAKATPGTPRRYHDIVFWTRGPTEGFVGADRIQFLDANGDDLFMLYGGTPSASHWQASYPAANAFGTGSTQWATSNTQDYSYLRLDYGAGNAYPCYGVKVKLWDGLDPHGFVVRTSDDLTNFDYLFYVVGLDFANGETKTFTF